MITLEGTVPFPPTMPQSVAAFGTSCATVAQALGAASTQVSTTTTAAAAAWQGSASSAFQAQMSTTTTSITQVAQQLARVQPIITTYVGQMTAAETSYNTAVAQQMAAIAAGPTGLAAEAAAIVAEGVALAELEAAGVVCAGALSALVAGVAGDAVSSLFKSLFAPLTTGEMIEHGSGSIGDLAGAAAKEVGTLTTEVSGYVKKSGTAVNDYVRYARGAAAKYGTEISASTVHEIGEVAKKLETSGKLIGGVVTIVETEDKYDELVKEGIPEPAAAAEALFARVGPTLAGSFAGGVATGFVEGEGVVEGGAVGTLAEPGGGTAVGAIVGAVVAAAPAAAAGTAADLVTTRVATIAADSALKNFNEWAFPVKTEGPKQTVLPPTSPEE